MNEKAEQEIYKSMDVIKQSLELLLQTNMEVISEIQGQLQYINLVICKVDKD
ncbi:MAG: hypothetical protein ACLSWI_04410 [Candidatus Gastranaerophilaceae bacterium]